MTISAGRGLAALALALCSFSGTSAQIMELREVGGKTISCMHTGLMSDLNDCGGRSDWYTYVFVGSISAITPADQDEKRLQITPDEVFHGEPPTPLTVLTSQGECLPTMAVGDRWLFFFRQEKDKPIVLDYYGSISRPVADAQDQVETLRQLKTIGEFGIVRGSVEGGAGFWDRKPVAGAHVIAARKPDNPQFFATTNSNGYFEFEPLNPGKYDLKVDPVGSFLADGESVEVTSGSCWNITMSRSPHAGIGGHIRHPDGSSVAQVPALIIDEDGSGYSTEKTDASGYFHSDGMRSGKYVVGINLPGAPTWKYGGCGGACEVPPASLYYPGMHNRSDALVIILADDEKRDDIDFVVPAP